MERLFKYWGKSLLGLISFVTIVGSALWQLGKPPYMNEAAAQAQYQATTQQIQTMQQQFSQRFASQRLNEVDAQVVSLRNVASTRRLTPAESELLRRLELEKRQLLCELRIEKCG